MTRRAVLISKKLALAIPVILALAAPACAQDYSMSSSVTSSGGGVVTSSRYHLAGTVGQPVGGFAKRTRWLEWVGFWAEDVPAPRIVGSIAGAKQLKDGNFISAAGKIAVSGTDQLTGLADRFSEFFYIVEPTRVGGIRVSCPSWPVAGLFRGSTVNVIGSIGTLPTGERHITSSIVVIGATVSAPQPLGMSNRRIGGGDAGTPPFGQCGVVGGSGLNNIGALVKTWGKIIDHGLGYLIVDDGSAPGIRIDTTGLANVPTEGYISVVGNSSLHPGGLPLLLPRAESDIDQPTRR